MHTHTILEYIITGLVAAGIVFFIIYALELSFKFDWQSTQCKQLSEIDNLLTAQFPSKEYDHIERTQLIKKIIDERKSLASIVSEIQQKFKDIGFEQFIKDNSNKPALEVYKDIIDTINGDSIAYEKIIDIIKSTEDFVKNK